MACSFSGFTTSRNECTEGRTSKIQGHLEVTLGVTHFTDKAWREAILVNVYGVSRRRWWQPTPVLLPGKSHGRRSLGDCSPWDHWGSDRTERLHFHALEKEMATHSSVFAWRIPGTGEPGGLLSMGSHRVGHDWSDLAAAAVAVWG